MRNDSDNPPATSSAVPKSQASELTAEEARRLRRSPWPTRIAWAALVAAVVSLGLLEALYVQRARSTAVEAIRLQGCADASVVREKLSDEGASDFVLSGCGGAYTVEIVKRRPWGVASPEVLHVVLGAVDE